MAEPVSRDAAAAALAQAATTRVVSAADAQVLTAYLVGIGAAVAGVLAASWWMLSHDSPAGFAAIMGGYAVVILLLVEFVLVGWRQFVQGRKLARQLRLGQLVEGQLGLGQFLARRQLGR